MSGGPPPPSTISGRPDGVPPLSELWTAPVSRVLRALSRVTVGPAPGEASPTALSAAALPGSKGGTIRTALAAAGAAASTSNERSASARVMCGVSRIRKRRATRRALS